MFPTTQFHRCAAWDDSDLLKMHKQAHLFFPPVYQNENWCSNTWHVKHNHHNISLYLRRLETGDWDHKLCSLRSQTSRVASCWTSDRMQLQRTSASASLFSNLKHLNILKNQWFKGKKSLFYIKTAQIKLEMKQTLTSHICIVCFILFFSAVAAKRFSFPSFSLCFYLTNYIIL